MTRLLPNKKASSLHDNIVTQAVCVDQDLTTSIDHQLRTNLNNVKDNETWETTDKGYNTVSTTKSNDSLWTQNQQKQFEKALATVPKDASDRWTQIAKNVPGKSKVYLIISQLSYLTLFNLNDIFISGRKFSLYF